jgi:predicted Zn-dependent protease with MMP-like domain
MVRVASRALRSVPSMFAGRAAQIVAMVQRMPTREEARTMGRRRRASLLGMFRPGTGGSPDAIVVFRRPILRASRARRNVRAHVGLTVLHELGHALGLGEGAVSHL